MLCQFLPHHIFVSVISRLRSPHLEPPARPAHIPPISVSPTSHPSQSRRAPAELPVFHSSFSLAVVYTQRIYASVTLSVRPTLSFSTESTRPFLTVMKSTAYEALYFGDDSSCSGLMGNRQLNTIHQSLSHVQLFATPWTVQPARLFCPWDFPGRNTGVGWHFLLQQILLIQRSNSGLPHCRQTLYCQRHQRVRQMK